MRSDDVLREAGVALIAARAKKARKQAAGAEKGDPNAIHDLRVAIRRVRAAVSVLTETVLDPDATRREERALKRLFRALGEARDNDVAEQRLEAMVHRCGLTSGAVDELAKLLRKRKTRAKKGLARELARRPVDRTLERLLRAVAEQAAPPPGPVADRQLVRHFAPSVLLARFERVLAFELALPAPLPVLHRLRIALKKLRYALDFFAEALGPEAAEVERTLKTAQDQLGELHDHQIAVALVARFQDEHGPRGSLARLRDAEDAEAARLLTEFDSTWKQIAGGQLAGQLLGALGALVGPPADEPARLALRRAERGSDGASILS